MGRWPRRLAPWLLVAVVVLAAWRLWPAGAGAPALVLDPTVLLAALPAAEPGTAPGPPDVSASGGDWQPELPRDLGPHPDARAEVWDLGGQLRDDTGARTAIRLTLIRLTLAPHGVERASPLAAAAVLLGRFELVPAQGAPLTTQRASRVAAGLAGAEPDPPRVWLEDWSLALGAAAGEAGDSGALDIRLDDVRLQLTLTPNKAVLAPAAALLDRGAPSGRRPDADPGLRWLTQPRLALAGRLTRAGRDLAVTGSGWLDHVWGDAAAADGIAGSRGQLALNRFMLQLDDGSDLLCIQLHRRAGGGTPIPTCLAIAADGATRVLQRRDLTLAPGDARWRSPADGARYPIAWRLAAPALGLVLRIDALRSDQEVRLGEPLWSGAITVTGERNGRAVGGGGRMDLSGYADS